MCHDNTYVATLATLLSKVLIVTRHTDEFVIFPRDKAVVADGMVADRAQETAVVIPLTVVLKLLHS